MLRISRALRAGALHKLDKVTEQAQSHRLALLRMKLCSENIVTPNGRGKLLSIGRAACDDREVGWLGKKAVHEVNVTSLGHSTKQMTTGANVIQPVPPNLGNF